MKKYPKFLAFVLSPFLVLAFAAGCSGPSLATDASLAFTAVDSVLAITDPSFDETQLIATSNAAIAALRAWTPGTSGANVIQALNDFEAVIKTLPATAIPTKYQDVIQVVVNQIDNIIATVNAGQSTTTATATQLAAVPTPTSVKAAVNASLEIHPELGQAKF